MPFPPDLGAPLQQRGAPVAPWLAAVLLAGIVAGPAAQSPPGRPVSVTGQVLDALTGRPIGRALVEVSPTTGDAYRNRRGVLTADDGRFRIDDLTPGRVRVVAGHPAYLSGGVGQQRAGGRVPSIEVPDRPGGDLTIRLWPPATVSGRVTDSTGAPLAGVGVEAVPVRWRDPNEYWSSLRTATNDRGEYELSGLPPGTYHLVVRARHMTWAVNSRRSQMFFPDAPDDASAMTSENGRFTWSPTIRASPPPLADGRETVFLTTGHPGVVDSEAFVPLKLEAGDERRNIDIVMQTAPRVRVRGIAVGPDGPLERVYVRLRQAGLDSEEDAVQTAGHADGVFEFLSVPPGTYELDAFRIFGESDVFEPDPDGYWARMPFTVGDRDIDDLTIRMTPGVTMRARVESLDQSNPRGGSLRLVSARGYPIGGGNGVQRWRPGTFEVRGLIPGDYLWSGGGNEWGVISVTRNGRDITGEPLRVGTSDIDDVVIAITGRPSGVRGRVAPPVGTSVELLSVIVFPLEPGRRGFTSYGQTLVRALNLPPDGTYSFEGLPPGRYVVAAIDEAERTKWPAPDLLERLASTTPSVTVTTGQILTHDLVAR